jgi:hypothetical protein
MSFQLWITLKSLRKTGAHSAQRLEKGCNTFLEGGKFADFCHPITEFGRRLDVIHFHFFDARERKVSTS